MNTSEKHAVVLRGSLAGLLAARVLADHFEHVLLNHGLYGSVKIDLHRSVQSVAETT